MIDAAAAGQRQHLLGGGAVGSIDDVGRAERSRHFQLHRQPVDRDEWELPAHIVNAYYHPTLNEIVVPAGILQPPMFDAGADDAVNFGGIGTVIAHEITHGFDDQGRRFDADGHLRDWWTPEDATRFTALSAGEVDLLSRNTTWTVQRDTELKLDFSGVNYYDGQGFIVKKDLGVASAKELDGATVCIQTGTTTELNLADWAKANNVTYKAVNIDSNAEGEQQYTAGACDAYTTDASGLAATRAAFADPDNHIILPEIISKEPLGPVVRHGDNNWTDIVRWTLYALVSAEEYGVTSANLDELSRSSTNPDVQRMLGTIDDYGTMLGLDKEWAKRAIAASGNYGEIFAANIGEQTPIGLPRGLNALWTQGGLMYAMPFR